jgi:hypothetical protein
MLTPLLRRFAFVLVLGAILAAAPCAAYGTGLPSQPAEHNAPGVSSLAGDSGGWLGTLWSQVKAVLGWNGTSGSSASPARPGKGVVVDPSGQSGSSTQRIKPLNGALLDPSGGL